MRLRDVPFLLVAGCSSTSATITPASTGDAGPAPDAAPEVLSEGVARVEQGLVQGARVGDTWAFKGIPYAEPPVGDLRFRPPRPALGWAGTRDATKYGEPCPQIGLKGDFVGQEDCLKLNVWTPTARPTTP